MERIDTGGVTAHRNNSLSSSGQLLVFGFIFLVGVGIAPAITWIFGAALILSFAGLAMLGLYLGFRHIERHAGDWERVAI